MAYTVDDLTAKITLLETALSQGVLRVSFADRATEYRSVEDLEKAIAYFQKLKNELLGRPKQTLAVASKGF